MFEHVFSFLKTRIGVSLVVAIFIVIGALIVQRSTQDGETTRTPTAIAVEKIVKKSLDEDPDNDGLKTWEEAIYKTDPGNPDTDGDGISDGEEVTRNTNPLVRENENGSATSTSDSTGPSFTATDRFSQELFVRYVEAKKAGLDISVELSEEIAATVLDKDYTNEDVPSISEADVRTSDTTYARLVSYGNAVGTITTRRLPEGGENELIKLERVANDPSLTAQTSFTDNITRYKEMIDALRALEVPRAVVGGHIKVINGLYFVLYATEGMALLDTDPVGALSRIPLHEDGLSMIEAGALELRRVFASRNITFTSQEPGYAIIAE